MEQDSQIQTYDLAGLVIGCAMEVHQELSHGFCESVYHNALMVELSAKGFEVQSEHKIKVYYKGHAVGDFSADILVNNSLTLELKATRALNDAHEVQLVNYLTATKQKVYSSIWEQTASNLKRNLRTTNQRDPLWFVTLTPNQHNFVNFVNSV
jgi:GxxExxY protein